MSQGNDQLASSPSENASGAEGLSLDDIAALSLDGDEEGEEDEQSESDELQLEDEDSEDEDQPTAKRRLKVGDEELDEDEVVSGYMRQKDYTHKTEALAAQRREIEAVRQQVASEREERANALDVLIGELHQELLGIDQNRLNGLLDTDPKAYLKAKEHIEAKTQRIQRAIQSRLALNHQAAAEQAREMAEYAQQEQQRLSEKLPEWKDPKRAQSEAREIEGYLRKEGYQDNELNELLDSRAVIVARKAMLYDKLVSARGQKAAEKPQSGPIRPGTPSNTNQKAVTQKRAVERYRANPNSIDALAALVGSS